MRYNYATFCNKDMPVPTKVWDVEKKELLGTFESRTAAAEFLGVDQRRVTYAYQTKSRIYKNKLGKVVCIR